MAQKRRKKKKKRGTGSKKPSPSSSPASRPHGSSGGVMQSLRSGFRRAAGAESRDEKPSTLSNVVWLGLLLAAVGFLLYRIYG